MQQPGSGHQRLWHRREQNPFLNKICAQLPFKPHIHSCYGGKSLKTNYKAICEFHHINHFWCIHYVAFGNFGIFIRDRSPNSSFYSSLWQFSTMTESPVAPWLLGPSLPLPAELRTAGRVNFLSTHKWSLLWRIRNIKEILWSGIVKRSYARRSTTRGKGCVILELFNFDNDVHNIQRMGQLMLKSKSWSR